MRQFRFLIGCAAVAAMGVLSDGASQEVSAGVADSLRGGCDSFKITGCNVKYGPHTGCPLGLIFRPNETPTVHKGKGKDKLTCGGVKKPGTNCSESTGFAHLDPCGSSSGSGGSGSMGSTGMDP